MKNCLGICIKAIVLEVNRPAVHTGHQVTGILLDPSAEATITAREHVGNSIWGQANRTWHVKVVHLRVEHIVGSGPMVQFSTIDVSP